MTDATGGAPQGGAMARSTNELLTMGGAAAAAIAVLLGVVIEEWDLNLAQLIFILGGAAVVVLAFLGLDRPYVGFSARSLIRALAALIAVQALIDVGDLASSLGQWSSFTIILVIIEAAGAAVLAYGAWALSGGNLVADLAAVAGAMRLTGNDRLIYGGAAGVIVAWFLLMAIGDVYSYGNLPQFVVACATLVLIFRWIERNPTVGKSPLPGGWSIGISGAVAVLAGAFWFLSILGRSIEFGEFIALILAILFVGALALLGAGVFFLLQPMLMAGGGPAAGTGGGSAPPDAGGGGTAA